MGVVQTANELLCVMTKKRNRQPTYEQLCCVATNLCVSMTGRERERERGRERLGSQPPRHNFRGDGGQTAKRSEAEW